MENYCCFTLRMLAGKNHLQIKLKTLTKSMNINMDNWYIKSTNYKRFLH